MKAYYFDDEAGDCRLPHTSGKDVSLDDLASLGVLYRSLPVSAPSSAESLENLASERHYANRDQIVVSPKAMGAVYEDKIKMFFDEHMHEDEEIRYILDGAGYFDVRANGDDRWIRIRLEDGDLLVLPPGIYHRFTVDENNYIKAMRLFKEEPKWTPLNRGDQTDVNPLRQQYVTSRQAGFKA